VAESPEQFTSKPLEKRERNAGVGATALKEDWAVLRVAKCFRNGISRPLPRLHGTKNCRESNVTISQESMKWLGNVALQGHAV
jgi:hypothetical protein